MGGIIFWGGIVITLVTAIPVIWQLGKHPRGLYVLFFAEMWERFSYYGMRGLLIFFLTQHFLFTDEIAQQSYATYTSLVYLMPLIGGYLADRYLGTRKAIAFGALLLVAGHFSMAFEGKEAVQTLTYKPSGQVYEFVTEGRMSTRKVQLMIDGQGYEVGASPDGGMEIKGFAGSAALPGTIAKGDYTLGVKDRNPLNVGIIYMAMALIIMGVGFLKANISSIVGQLYAENDPRRDPGFTLYYYGINLGAFWAAILCGWLGEVHGWGYGFGLAGIGMLVGYVVFVLGKPLLEGHGEPPEPEKLAEPVLGPLNREWTIYLFAIAGVAVVWYLLQINTAGEFNLLGVQATALTWLQILGTAGLLGYLAFHMLFTFTAVETQRVILAIVLTSVSVVFWALFEQAGSSLNQFAERNTILEIAGNSITAAQTQSYNSGFILLMAPAFSALWAYLGARGMDPRPAEKFGIALIQVGLGFLVLVYGSQTADENYKVAQMWLILAYLLHTTGELCISPVGLSQMTRLSPSVVVSTVMAGWFLASSWAQNVGGWIAQLTATETVAGQVLDPKGALATYVQTFWDIGIIGMIIGAILLLLSPFLNFLAHDDKPKE